jgi:replication-associated recombination protein RarA
MSSHQLVGHPEVTAYFENALAQGRLPHACLLQGPRGVGKATFAQALATHLLYNTPSLRQLDAAHRDVILSKAHPDCLYIQAAKEETLGIEEIRDIPSFAQRTATGWKVIVLDSIDDATPNAANALLKVLEEPPAHTLFLIITHMPGKILPTIKSRCHGVPFCPLQAKDMESVIQEWKPDITADTYELVSHLSQGSLGTAQQFLEIEGEIIPKITNLFTQALQGKSPAPSALDGILKDKHYDLSTYLMTYWCQQITYLHHQQPYYLPVGLFPQNLLQKIQDFSPVAWLDTVRDINHLIQQQRSLKLDTKHTLLTLFYKLGRPAV